MKEIVREILTQLPAEVPPPPSYFQELKTYKVTKVSDGDTIDAIGDGDSEAITVRFVHIDTAETAKGWGDSKVEKLNGTNRVYESQFHWGKKSQERLQELVEQSGGKVKLKITGEEKRPGRSPRCFGEVYLLDGTFVQYILVREGLAQIYYDYFGQCPRETAILLMLAEAEAEAKGLGIWQESKSEFLSPWLFRSLKTKQKNFLKNHSKEIKAGNMTEDKLSADFENKLTEFQDTLNIISAELTADRMTQAEFEEQLKAKIKQLY